MTLNNKYFNVQPTYFISIKDLLLFVFHHLGVIIITLFYFFLAQFLMAIAKALVLGLDIVRELVVWVECSVGVGAIKRAKGATAW